MLAWQVWWQKVMTWTFGWRVIISKIDCVDLGLIRWTFLLHRCFDLCSSDHLKCTPLQTHRVSSSVLRHILACFVETQEHCHCTSCTGWWIGSLDASMFWLGRAQNLSQWFQLEMSMFLWKSASTPLFVVTPTWNPSHANALHHLCQHKKMKSE